jgi:anti-sigma-K factor RskA
MSADDCERLRYLAAELALGIADGEERAWALDHLATCAGCQAQVERLSAVADDLVLLAPAAEPSAGFEARVAKELTPARRRAPWPRRFAIPAFAALAAAAVAAAAVWIALDDDRDLAGAYRDTLAVANGEYFDAAPLEAPGGEGVGYVYGYQGRTSWVMLVVYDGVETGRYRADLVTEDGRHRRLGEIDVNEGKGSVGAATPVPYEDLAEMRLLDGRGREVADSELRE